MSERTVWLLTRAINAYDQEGDYFVAVFSAKPSAVALQAHGVSASAVEHVLRGGGREPKDKNEKLYVWESVQTCWGTDLCLLDMPRDNAVYLVRGSEMYRFVLPELPPPDPTMGTGAKSIDRMLPDKE